jgi:hypothetical protein
MMRFRIAILAVAISLAGCAGSLTVGTPQNIQAITIAKQSLTAAHALHDVFALSASAAANSRTCIGTCATKAKDFLDKSEALLVAADGLSDPTNIAADVSAAVNLINQAKGLGL